MTNTKSTIENQLKELIDDNLIDNIAEKTAKKIAEFKSERLKIVVLDNPSANYDNPFVRDLLSKVLELKIRGFRQRWPKEYLPVCKSDFFGTNLVLCLEMDTGLQPLVAYRAVTKKRCDQYHFKFPGYTLCDNTGSLPHINAVRSFNEESLKQGKNLAYSSVFTIDHWMLIDKEKIPRKKVRNIVDFLLPLFAYQHIHWKVDHSVAVGSVKTKTDQMYHRMGLFPIKYKGEELPPQRFPELGDGLFEVQTLTTLTDESLAAAQRYLPLWKDRIHISDENQDWDAVENYLAEKRKLKKTA